MNKQQPQKICPDNHMHDNDNVDALQNAVVGCMYNNTSSFRDLAALQKIKCKVLRTWVCMISE